MICRSMVKLNRKRLLLRGVLNENIAGMKPQSVVGCLWCLCLLIAGCATKRVAPPPAPFPPTIQAATPAAAMRAVTRVGPAALYPTGQITPGKAQTLKLTDLTARYTERCPSGKTDCTYSQSHRKVSSATHKQIYESYDVPSAKRKIQFGEVDHFYPLCAGGSNDAANLWYQPADNPWNGKNYGYHEKDHLEAYVCSEIKAGRLAPKTAYDRITNDWVAYYLEFHPDSNEDGPDPDVD